jgi:hypothetical protein
MLGFRPPRPTRKHAEANANNPSKANTPTRAHLSQIKGARFRIVKKPDLTPPFQIVKSSRTVRRYVEIVAHFPWVG